MIGATPTLQICKLICVLFCASGVEIRKFELKLTAMFIVKL